ncbi:MAG: NAD(P)-dependent oxidoreductase [Rhodospirillales bacterium]|jgi:3-hydroxyisobutyrate dehydrogenase|nr:NAD(P)-dependent oxidoreductase [Rhodospirillales bacterium]MBT4007314.1 NAD(P)-dependent oxidoreductase [Rhodospirillales bacterium]MBT5076982.1 NAD(P)-dependent oxidoreductase [Rhodospirillales bacterium]MBT5113647.1 NAD(P)-dependent oxidoreductase [Rhodospirillales bacterium]MBT5673945.1 NAD(P)-dependent oxidoreductase [Rhodospirillales bacterium]
MTQTVGLIGVGAMGQALLHRLHLAGHQVQVYDINQTQMDLAQESGAIPKASAIEAASDVDHIHLFVRSDQDFLDVTLGPDGILTKPGIKKNAVLYLHGTVLPETTQKIGAEALKQGIRPLDAPITAVPRVVHAGNATFLIGGEDDTAKTAETHLAGLGKAVYHFGALGSGNAAKIVKNLINANERIALSEALNIAEASGLDVKQFMEMALSADGGSTSARWEKAFNMDGNHPVPRPASNMLNKDIHLAAKFAKILGLDTPMTQGASDTAAKWVAGWEKDKL